MSQSKIGRPGKREQTRPMIYERARSSVTRQISMSAKTAENLDRYVKWAAAEVGAEEDEALVLTVDQALEQFFQRDKLFHGSIEDKTEGGNGKATGASGSAAATSHVDGSRAMGPSAPTTTRPAV
jgi:hypothetical protein